MRRGAGRTGLIRSVLGERARGALDSVEVEPAVYRSCGGARSKSHCAVQVRGRHENLHTLGWVVRHPVTGFCRAHERHHRCGTTETSALRYVTRHARCWLLARFFSDSLASAALCRPSSRRDAGISGRGLERGKSEGDFTRVSRTTSRCPSCGRVPLRTRGLEFSDRFRTWGQARRLVAQ